MSLTLERASVRAGAADLLVDATIGVAPGEIVVLLGPNGAGKTTLFTVAAGARRPHRGRVALDGVDLDAWPATELARRRAVMAQSSKLAFAFRVHEVVMLGRAPHRGYASAREDADVVDAAMMRTDLIGLAERLYPTLSGGEQQRVQLARALAQVWPSASAEPGAFLLLDEPTSNLDLKHQAMLLGILREFAADGGGVLLILHDLNLAAAIAHRIALLHHGRIVAHGTPEEVLTPHRVSGVYDLPAQVQRDPLNGRLHVTADIWAAGPGAS